MLEALAISLESRMQGIVFVFRAGSVIEALSRPQKVRQNHVQGSVRFGFKLAVREQVADLATQFGGQRFAPTTLSNSRYDGVENGSHTLTQGSIRGPAALGRGDTRCRGGMTVDVFMHMPILSGLRVRGT